MKQLFYLVCFSVISCSTSRKTRPSDSYGSSGDTKTAPVVVDTKNLVNTVEKPDTTKPVINPNKPVAPFSLTPSTNLIGIDVPVRGDIQALVDKIPDGGKAVFKLSQGDYLFSKTLTWKNKSIWLIGTNGTRFVIKNGITGVVINRDRSIGRSRLENIEIVTNGEKINPKANGIEVHAITDLYHVSVKNFAGKGISYTADIASAKTDVSQSQLFNCEVSQCGSDGYYFQGGDVNQINVIGCSARDNGGIGFYDKSFLGNQFFACMGHANKGGHYRVDGGNARSTFTGCYGEEDSPPSFFGGVARVYGGLLGWELTNRNGKLFYKDDGKPYRGTGGYIVSAYAKVDTH